MEALAQLRQGLLPRPLRHDLPRALRIKRRAEAMVAGEASDLAQGAGVGAAAGLFQVRVKTQERRVKNTGNAARARSVMEYWVFSPVRRSGGDRAQPFDEVIEGMRLVHATTPAGPPPKRTVTIV